MSDHDAVTFETFDPNQPDRSNVWGIYNDAVFKTKANRPAALNALKSCYRGKLFELVNGTWLLRAVKDPLDVGRSSCEHCGLSLRRPASRWDYKTRTQVYDHDVVLAEWTWRRQNGKITSPPELLALCSACTRFYR